MTRPVLIVEDEPDIAEGLRYNLEREGFAAVVALTGFHMWLAARRRAFAQGRNTLAGRTYRIMNEVPTLLLVLIVVMVIVKPF